MCGIVGFTSNQPNANLAKFALNNLSHRGPDSQNFKEIKFGNSFLYLGSTRLCIKVIIPATCLLKMKMVI